MLPIAGERREDYDSSRPLTAQSGGNPLAGKKVFIPPMAYGSARAFASAFRALGVEADITPPSNHRTLELGGRYTSGEECYPAKVTVGDFLRVLEDKENDPARTVLFMPTADGPCRFGQYAPHLRVILKDAGYAQTEVLSPTSQNSYADLGSLSGPFMRTGWRMLVAADILQKALLRYRPNQEQPGGAEAAYRESLDDLCHTAETTTTEPGPQLKALEAAMRRGADRFHQVARKPGESKLLIGVVGEIFCRLNTFSNESLVERIEEFGAEVWLSDITEWIWYTNSERFRKLKLLGKQWSLETLGAWIRTKVQHRDELALRAPFERDFEGIEEPEIEVLLEYARPYLPPGGALGEMVLNIGKSVYLAKKGAHGVVDISPFTCMNGIVSEAIYPKLSRDLGGIPIRTFYFDGTQSDLERDLGVYLELARSYQRKQERQAAAAKP